MTPYDMDRFARVMATLGEVFDTVVTPVRVEAYCRALGEVPIAAVEQAAAWVIREGRYFPKPVDLREALGLTAEQRAEVAWATLLRAVRSRRHAEDSVRFEPVLMATVVHVWGTWPAARAALGRLVDDPAFLGQRKWFLAQYRLGLVGPPAAGPRYLPGDRELQRLPSLERSGDGYREVVCERVVYFAPDGPPVIEPHPAPIVRELPAAPPIPPRPPSLSER
jgi:hypothetical protein